MRALRAQAVRLLPLLIPLLIGGALRFWMAWSWRGTFGPYYSPGEEGYYEAGVVFLGDHVFTPDIVGLKPQAWRGPLYPAFIAGVESPFSRPWPGHVYFFQALLSTLAIALAYVIGAQVLSPMAGFFAALLLALDAAEISSVVSLNVHLFYSIILLAAAAFAARWAERGDRRSGVWLGVALAATLLTRTAHFLAVPLLLGASLVWWGPKQGLKKSGWVAAALLAALLPYVARNYFQFGRLVPLDGGMASYNAMAAAAGIDTALTIEKGVAEADSLEVGFKEEIQGDDRDELEAKMLQASWSLIRSDPALYLDGFLRRLKKYWRPAWPMLALSLLALLVAPRSRPLAALFLLTLALSGHALIGMGRGYRIASFPLICLLAGCGLGAAWPPAGARPLKLGRGADGLAAAFLWPYGALLILLVSELGFRGWPSPAATAGFDGHSRRVTALFEQGAALSAGRWNRSMGWEELHERPLLAAGLAAVKRGDLKSAAASFEKAARVAPHEMDPQMDLGAVRQRLGDRPGALAAFTRAKALARAQGLRAVEADASSALSNLKRRKTARAQASR